MCANYKDESTFEVPHDPDQLTYLEEFENFPPINSPITEDNCFSRIHDVIYHLSSIISEIKENEDNEENEEVSHIYFNIENLAKCLKELLNIFENEIYGNIDDFLEKSEIIQLLFHLLDYKNGWKISIGTQNSIYILNILALITRNSPYSYCFIDKYVNLLTSLLNSPDLLPRVITIFLYSIDGAPQIIENLILDKDLISRLTIKYFEIKDLPFAGPIFTLISILFDYISFDNIEVYNSCQQYDEDNYGNKLNYKHRNPTEDPNNKNILIKFDYINITCDGLKGRFEFSEKTQNTVTKIFSSLQSLINTLDGIEIKKSIDVNPRNLYPILKILEKYLKCFANKDNFYGIMRYVKNAIDSLFRMPLYFDQSGKIFCQVLAIYNQILNIQPNYFLPSQSAIVTVDYFNNLENQKNEHHLMIPYIDILFEYISKYDMLRLDLLFLLSNLVKFREASYYILLNKLITKNNFYGLMNKLTYSKKENALITLLTIFSFYPKEFYNELSENFNDFIDLVVESVDSTTVNYFIQMFLCVIDRIMSSFPKLLANVDKESLIDCLSSLAANEESNIARDSQSLIEQYFNGEDE